MKVFLTSGAGILRPGILWPEADVACSLAAIMFAEFDCFVALGAGGAKGAWNPAV